MRTRIETLLQRAVSAAFPDVQSSVQLRPLTDLARGHVGTDICQQIAAVRKEAPAMIAERVLPEVQPTNGMEVSFDEGFLNVRLTGGGWKLLQLEDDAAQQPQEHTIIVSPHPDTVPAGDYLRLFSYACIQALHLLQRGCKVEFQLQEQNLAITDVRSLLSCYALYAQSIITSPRGAISQDAAALKLISMLEKNSSNPSTLWLTPRSLTRKRYSELFKDALQCDTQIVCPSSGILTGMDTHGLIPLINEHTLATMLYIGSVTPAADLDWLVPVAGEASNCIWFTAALLDRASSLGWLSMAGDPLEAAAIVDPGAIIEYAVTVRAAQMEHFSYFAGFEGAVLDWRQSFEWLLEGANRLMNSPRLRIALESGTVSAGERKIITGVLKSVSDMMNLWRVD